MPLLHPFGRGFTENLGLSKHTNRRGYTGRSPTKSTSENPVNIAKGGMPWEGNASGKYQYHPGGDPNAAPKDAPSALNAVVVPNVTLPKELHDKFNKWGKDGYP